jgi:hypothetical protein
MTNLTATAGWDAVPQIEPTTALLGGPGGPLNAPAQALANRTEWLRSQTLSVKDPRFAGGAKGDGVTDDSAALNAAAAALQSGQSLYFPAGTYIVNTACVVFSNKQRIRVYGDGKATIVRPSEQGVAPSKQDYPSTIQFDQCSYVSLQDMTIESKGESYGNIDAYGALSSGDARAQAIAAYGGSALVVSRSDNVLIANIDARRCGSCGVVYLSSCEDIVVMNSFANARSLGYAGFAIDNWAESAVKTKRTYKFIGCRVGKEDASYSGKAGIASEGDQIAGRTINLDVQDCIFEDCATGSNVLYLGAGISCFDTRLTVQGLSVKNSYIGITWQKRGGAVDKSWCRVQGSVFDSCAVAGAYIAIGTATGGADVSFIGTRMDIQPSSVWSSQADNSVKYSSGITVAGYTNGEINVVGGKINGGQYGLWAIDNTTFTVTGGEISGSLAAIRTYGGGTLKATGARLRVTAGDRVIGRDTGNLAATASYNLYTYVSGNRMECANDTASDYIVALGGNSALFAETQIIKNSATKGVYAAGKGSASLYDVDFSQSWSAVVGGSTTAGTYEINAGSSAFTCIKNGQQVTLSCYITLAATITGGGTGNLQITGIPYPKRANSAAFGSVAFSGLDYAVDAQVTPYFGGLSSSSTIVFWQTADVSNVSLVPISAVSGGKILAFSITYETDK